MSTPRELRFLVVDDNDLDVERVERSLKSWGVTNETIRAVDGIDAFDCLRGTNGRSRVDGPYVILLDLNMPRMNGVEFLDELRKDPDLSGATVIVLSTSERPLDKQATQALGAENYLVKPYTNDKLFRALAGIGSRCTLLPPTDFVPANI